MKKCKCCGELIERRHTNAELCTPCMIKPLVERRKEEIVKLKKENQRLRIFLEEISNGHPENGWIMRILAEKALRGEQFEN